MNEAQTKNNMVAPGWTATVDLKVILAFATIYIVWGSTYLAIRYALESLPPFLMVGLRFTLAGLLLFIWNGLRNRRLPTFQQWKFAIVGGVLMFVGGHGGLAWAEQRLPSGIAALILALTPAWIVLLDWLRPRGTRPAANVWIGLLLGFLGLIMLVAFGKYTAMSLDISSTLILVFSGFAWAAGTVYTKHTPPSGSASDTAAMQLLSGGVLLLLISVVRGEWHYLPSTGIEFKSILALGYLIVFGSLVAFSAYVWLLSVSAPSRVATYAYVNPVIAILLGWALASELISLQTLMAATIIIISVVIITRHSTKIKQL